SEWARTEIRTRGDVNAGVQKRPERHAALHQVFTIEEELVSVVIRVGSKQSRHGVQCASCCTGYRYIGALAYVSSCSIVVVPRGRRQIQPPANCRQRCM